MQSHAFQLYLAVENIDHTKTKARHPQTNGICERFHRTIKTEFYDIVFRQKVYHNIEQLQTDLDDWLMKHNEQRPHSGKYGYGKTPMQTFRESLHSAKSKMMSEIKESEEPLESCSTPDSSDSQLVAYG